MKINISEVILDVLMTNEKVSLPGIGSIIVQHKGAAFSPGKQTLDPPSSSIEFSEEQFEDTALIEKVKEKYSLDDEKAGIILTTFSNEILNGFLNYDKVSIKNIGILKRGEDGVVGFETSRFLKAWLSDSFPTLEVEHIEPTQASTAVEEIENDKASTESSTEEIEPSIKEVPAPSMDKGPEITEQKLPERVDYTTTKSTLKPASEIEPVSYTPPVEEKDGMGLLWLLPLLLTLLLIGGIIWGIRWYNQNAKTSKATQEMTLDSTENAIASDTMVVNQDTDVAAENNTSAEVASTDENPQECIIIIGSYRNESNINEMLYKIKDKGLVSYTEKYGPYIRVGFTFDCRNVDLETYISQVREQLGDQSWYLVPNVAY